MLPCTRRCLSRRVHNRAVRSADPFPIAAPAPAPAPPLLFLCPRWFTTTVTRRQSPAPSHDGSHTVSEPSSKSLTPALSGTRVRLVRDYGYVKDAVRDRIARLPRSNLPAESLNDQEIADLAGTAPSYKTAREAVVDPRFVTHISSKNSRREREAQFRRLRDMGLNSNPAWQELINLLCTLPVDRELADGKLFETSEAFITYFTASSRPNTWFHSSGSGSVVQVLPSSRPLRGSRKLVLYGTERAIELAEQDLKKLQAAFEVLRDVSNPEPSRRSSPFDFSDVNSISTFTQFVRQITGRYVQRGLQRESPHTWVHAVANVLAYLFQHPDTSKFASVVALNRALLFVCKHTELMETRNLLRRCTRALHLGLETSTANILLQSTLKNHDFIRARSLLFEMRKLSTPANSHTWSMLFAATKIDIKVRVLRLMKERSLFMSPEAVSAVRKAALDDMFLSSRPTIEDLECVLPQLDDLFGRNWMTLDTYHHLLRLCGYREPLRGETIEFLRQLPAERSLVTNRRTKLYLLALERRQGLTRKTLASFIGDLRAQDHPAMRLAVPALFMAAWKRSFFNVCRVLWTNAALRGQISYEMQETVNRYLIRNASTDSRQGMKRRIGAKMIVGMYWWRPDRVKHLRATYPRLSAQFPDTPDPMLWLAKYTADDGTRDEQLSLAFLILKSDLESWKRFRPMTLEYFVGKLGEAYNLDQQWHKEGKLEFKHEDGIARVLAQKLRLELKLLKPGEVNQTAAEGLRQMRMLMYAANGKSPPSENGVEEEDEGQLSWWNQ